MDGNRIRNIGIIAHVDHGKTTLVDAMLRQSGVFRENEQIVDRVMDRNELERERGITIFSKNASIFYRDYKINIVDTPGHADFGGEVERILRMVDGVLLLVDACDGPMPQTRFVLKKSLELNLKPVVVINKIDRAEARPDQVLNEIFDLFVHLGANDNQLDFPVVYTSAKQGMAKLDVKEEGKDIQPLFETVVRHVPPPPGDLKLPFQMLVTTIDYNNYLGRIAIGKIANGMVKTGNQIALVRKSGATESIKILKLLGYQGLKQTEIEESVCGDIVAVAGLKDVDIGDTLSDVSCPVALPYTKIDEPTLSVNLIVNTSPFAGQDGKFVTSRQLRDRLFRELKSNVSLRIEEMEGGESFKVCGRGELHLGILIETMRREGYEFQVSKPEVILKEENGSVMEPVELLIIDVEEAYVGKIIEKLGTRKGDMKNMVPLDSGVTRLEYIIPARGLMGLRSEILTDTKGTGIMHHSFHGYSHYRGEISYRQNGVLIAMENGVSTTYALNNLQERSKLFIEAATPVYEGMIIGENSREGDMVVNPCKEKKLTNVRAAGSIKLTPPVKMSLEQALEYIEDDELVEITPENIRLRKKHLSASERKRKERGTLQVA
ncbi:MAG: translational GTPase TypA [Nitrospinae bacterium]|nr:translational GTPase TypA [Nitrospinota bacterium]